MNKDILLEYIEVDSKKATLYPYTSIPGQIGNAIYLYGDNQMAEIVAFIDMSPAQDGSIGMIITTDTTYFQFRKNGYFRYADIASLTLEKSRNDIKFKGTIKTKTSKYAFQNSPLNIEKFIQMLSYITNIKIEMKMNIHDKIAYFVPIVLSDIENDEYEDIELSPVQQNQILDFYQELEAIHRLDDDDYQYELELLCIKALEFFEELGLDSDEIDELYKVKEELDKKKEQENSMFDNAMKYYQDMMNKYQQGDTAMYDQVQNVMKSMGLNPDEIKDKSPEEIDQYLDELCQKFGISKSQLETIRNKFRN